MKMDYMCDVKLETWVIRGIREVARYVANGERVGLHSGKGEREG